MRLVCKALVRARQLRLLMASLCFIPTKPTKVCEDCAVVVKSITDNKITLMLRHTELPLACLYHEHAKEVFQAVQTLSRI